MCGIFGAISESFDRASGARALDTLAHRGPDGGSDWFDERRGVYLGHRRLSIIDLSDAGTQPMTNEDGSLVLTFNGEIYNHAVLRRGLEERGHRFRSQCDAEVVLHLYEEHGEACLERLVGMFAFALWDARRERLFAARDRLGIKPLHWYDDGRTFAFASELKALTALPGFDAEPDVTAYYDYLTYRYVPAPKTVYRRARKLRAGHYLVFEPGGGGAERRGVKETRWWDVAFEPREDLDEGAALEELHALARTVARDHLVSDVEVGAFLSSGIDSALVSALAREASGRAPRAFTVSFPERFEKDEARAAGVVAKLLGVDQTVYTFSQDETVREVDRLFGLFDEPFADHAALPLADLCRRTAAEVKVVLSGDGGDETHAGYPRYGKGKQRDGVFAVLDALPLVKHAIRGPALRVPWLRDLREDPSGRRHRFHAGIPREAKRLVLDFAGGAFDDYDDYWLLREHARPSFSPLAQRQYIDLVTLLPEGYLTKVDRASMAAGLEVRPPLLDHRMVEFAATLPDRLKRFEGTDRTGKGKPLLRALLLRLLPDYPTDTPKYGFSVPVRRFMESSSLFRLEHDVEVFDAFRIDASRVRRLLSPRRNSAELWILWTLGAFLAHADGGHPVGA